MGRGWLVILVWLGLLLLAACNGALPAGPVPDAAASPGIGTGTPLPGDEGIPPGALTPPPLPTAADEGSPRLDPPTVVAGATALAAVVTPSATPPAPTAEPTAVATAGSPLETTEPTTEPAFDEPTIEPEATSVPATPLPEVHVVQAGETLNIIAQLYGLTWQALADFNGIANPDQITAGQELQLPPVNAEQDVSEAGLAPEVTPETTATAEPETDAPSAQTEATHVVEPGETLYRISQIYGVSWVLIAEANGLITPNQIYAGQVLKIPISLPGPTPEFTHAVRSGETLFRIALQYGLSVTALAEANGLQAPYVIYPGQELRIPSDE